MDKEIIQLLKSSNPDDRIEGIKRLEASGHPDTVKILGALYKKETDPDVKARAAQVARKIKEGGSSAPAGAAKRSSGRRDPAAAKAHLEKAMDAMIAFQNDEAWVHAKKAFLADPELEEDDYAMGLASEITGADRTTAVETLLGGGGLAVEEKPKRGGKAKSSDAADRVGWGKALAGIGVYSLNRGTGNRDSDCAWSVQRFTAVSWQPSQQTRPLQQQPGEHSQYSGSHYRRLVMPHRNIHQCLHSVRI